MTGNNHSNCEASAVYICPCILYIVSFFLYIFFSIRDLPILALSNELYFIFLGARVSHDVGDQPFFGQPPSPIRYLPYLDLLSLTRIARIFLGHYTSADPIPGTEIKPYGYTE